MTSRIIYSMSCQICEGSQDLLDTSDEEQVQIRKKFRAVTNLEDQMSNWLRLICLSCKEKLDDLWDFRILCQNAYLKFLTEENSRIVTTKSASNDLCIDSDQEIIEWLDEIDEECNESKETNDSHQEREMIEIPILEESKEFKDASENLENERNRLEHDRKPEKVSHYLKNKKNSDKTPKEKRARKPRNTKLRPEKSFICDVCKMSFLKKRQLTKHINLNHLKMKRFQCHICGIKLSDHHCLRVHLQTHSDERIVCEICKKSYNTDVTFRSHFTKYHGETPKMYKCRFCSKEVRSRGKRTDHERHHTGEKPYKCTMCPKTFRVRKNLQKHINTHTREKTYPCEFCKKEFTNAGNLSVHKRIHTGEKPYECSNCSERFRELKMWKNHCKKCSETSETSQNVKRTKNEQNDISNKK